MCVWVYSPCVYVCISFIFAFGHDVCVRLFMHAICARLCVRLFKYVSMTYASMHVYTEYIAQSPVLKEKKKDGGISEPREAAARDEPARESP